MTNDTMFYAWREWVKVKTSTHVHLIPSHPTPPHPQTQSETQNMKQPQFAATLDEGWGVMSSVSVRTAGNGGDEVQLALIAGRVGFRI